VGATWQPIDDIRLRAARSRDIRAPNLNDLFQAGTANSDSVSNPGFVNGTSPPFVAPGQPPQAGYSYSGFATGNPNLTPEKSNQWNVGAVISPTFLPGFNLAVDYFNIKVNSGISSFSAQQIVNLCFLGSRSSATRSASILAHAEPGAALSAHPDQPFNAASQKVRGVDIDASYRLPLDRLFSDADGAFTLRGLATRYLRTASTAACRHGGAQHGGRERRPGRHAEMDLPGERLLR
jgi:outer membrane receptor protein involved in Fe transport